MLSATQRIDDVVINNVQGTCMAAPILLDKYLFTHDAGNIGQVTFQNVSIKTLGTHYDGQAGELVFPAAPAAPPAPL